MSTTQTFAGTGGGGAYARNSACASTAWGVGPLAADATCAPAAETTAVCTDGDQPTSSPHLRPQPLTVTRTCLDSPVLNGKPASARTRARNTYFAFPTVRVNL